MPRMRTSKFGSNRLKAGGVAEPSNFSNLPRVMGEPSILSLQYSGSYIQKFAAKNRLRPTQAEERFRGILRHLNGGVLKGRYRFQHPVSGRWIVDFFIPEIRLAIEIDGPIHSTRIQQSKDREKERDCKRFDITLLRLTNTEVYGDKEHLIETLRAAWRVALRRENTIIGKAYTPEK